MDTLISAIDGIQCRKGRFVGPTRRRSRFYRRKVQKGKLEVFVQESRAECTICEKTSMEVWPGLKCLCVHCRGKIITSSLAECSTTGWLCHRCALCIAHGLDVQANEPSPSEVDSWTWKSDRRSLFQRNSSNALVFLSDVQLANGQPVEIVRTKELAEAVQLIQGLGCKQPFQIRAPFDMACGRWDRNEATMRHGYNAYS